MRLLIGACTGQSPAIACADIAAARHAVGDWVPSGSGLATEYKSNRPMIREATEALEAQRPAEVRVSSGGLPPSTARRGGGAQL